MKTDKLSILLLVAVALWALALERRQRYTLATDAGCA